MLITFWEIHYLDHITLQILYTTEPSKLLVGNVDFVNESHLLAVANNSFKIFSGLYAP